MKSSNELFLYMSESYKRKQQWKIRKYWKSRKHILMGIPTLIYMTYYREVKGREIIKIFKKED
jgi:hypothetical protein